MLANHINIPYIYTNATEGDEKMAHELLKDLAKAKMVFQQRAIMAVINPVTVGMMEEGDICCICERELNETYGRPLACEDCGGDGVLDNEGKL